MPCRLKHLLPSVFLLILACGQPNRGDKLKAPFIAEIGGIKLSVPDSPAYKRPALDHPESAFRTVSFDLCPRSSADEALPEGCSAFTDLPMMNGGIRVLLRGLPVSTRDLVYFRAQPAVPPPPRLPLIPLRIKPGAMHIPGVTDVEAATIGRLRPPWPASIATTAQRWPTVVCSKPPPGLDRMSCAAGFLIGEMYVEAYWTDKPDVEITQEYVWSVATRITERIRALIR